ncbi:ASPIC/UnbV domain-containing protein, partial [Verrucomicrobia bacterium]|nr:ASPIC/UnbV domain-containing protein [Verrucomicrobiota bacterium]
NHYLAIQLIGSRSNRPAVGAEIRVDIEEQGQGRQIYRTVTSGGSFGASPFRQHLGLGQASVVSRMEIKWPSGDVLVINGPIEMDRSYRLTEGETALRMWDIPKIQFKLGQSLPGAAHAMHP